MCPKPKLATDDGGQHGSEAARQVRPCGGELPRNAMGKAKKLRERYARLFA